MRLVPDDVIAAYRLLLGRAPETDTTINWYIDRTPDLQSLVRSILSSPEAQNHLNRHEEHPHHIYRGYKANDAKVITQFDCFKGSGAPGFVVNFLGCHYRTKYSVPLNAFAGKVEDYPIPVGSCQGETAEFIGVLRSILDARNGRYRMLECGAGYGTWMAITFAAAAQKHISDVHVYGVEGDAGHYEFLLEHMADNNIAPSQFTAFKGAVGSHPGFAEWPVVDDPSAVYGSRPLGSDGMNYHGGRPARTTNVEVFALPQILACEPIWDLVHMDIQGGEGVLCRDCISILSEKVRRVVVGTHSRALDGEVMAIFHAAGWSLENEKPTISHWQDGASTLETMAAVDGVQVWLNRQISVERSPRIGE